MLCVYVGVTWEALLATVVVPLFTGYSLIGACYVRIYIRFDLSLVCI